MTDLSTVGNIKARIKESKAQGNMEHETFNLIESELIEYYSHNQDKIMASPHQGKSPKEVSLLIMQEVRGWIRDIYE